MKRIVLAGHPHHVVQRGLEGRQTFFDTEDYAAYFEIITESTRSHGVDILAYCLMPDHVHLIAVPGERDALSKCLRTAHGRYTRYINQRTGSRGQFWQGRYASHLLDSQYLIACTRYIEINPVKREYVDQPEDWQWSSAKAHMAKCDDALVKTGPLLEKVKTGWKAFLSEPRPPEEADLFYSHEKSGRPLGSDNFLAMVANHQ
ncbi:MAG: transposase [Desulfobacterales bacterium]|nr:transposase [Desulfobacterales bacterium]